MTHQEYEDFKNENKVSSLYVNTGDQVKDLMVEIYFEGFWRDTKGRYIICRKSDHLSVAVIIMLSLTNI